jgi:hypothetical protein
VRTTLSLGRVLFTDSLSCCISISSYFGTVVTGARIEQALAAATPSRPVKAGSGRKAAELAGRSIDKLGDPAATDEERAHRKRRLIKGPLEFHDVRRDQPKKKG